jgi:precorrin-2 dehydrogenase / sirohydrochlorin ferrochelatase
MHLFPLFLKLDGRQCLVVGAGTIAEGKIEGLLDTGAHLSVVAPEATEKIREWSRSAKLEWHQRPFQPSDLDGMFLVVASTNSTALHEQIFGEAQKRNVLCNIVDVPHLCDFYYPAVVRRGTLQIAISASGESPALAQRLRKDLEQQFGPEYEQWLTHLGHLRNQLQADKSLDLETRKKRLHALVTPEALTQFLAQNQKAPKK